MSESQRFWTTAGAVSGGATPAIIFADLKKAGGLNYDNIGLFGLDPNKFEPITDIALGAGIGLLVAAIWVYLLTPKQVG